MLNKPIFSIKLIICFVILYWPNFISAQSGEWVWLHGDSTVGSSGSFGIQGLSSPTNYPPSLYEPCEWKDLNGNFWLFGGGSPGYSAHNDLWKYNPLLNEWTWMKGSNTLNSPGVFGVKGVASSSNIPPSIGWGIVSWVDLLGNLWLYGGFQQPNVYSDLWKYDISTNMWIWINGPGIPNQIANHGTLGVPDSNNTPGSRYESASGWTDSNGDLWMFGGQESFGQSFNDVWKYNIATNTWTFMKGAATTNAIGSYILPGQEDSSNTPSARATHCRWKDSNGNFWIYGGINGGSVSLGDIWKFNPITNNWTYYNGISTYSNPSYGNICVESTSNSPGSRYENRAAWIDQAGNFYTFGGATNGIQNDLWMFNIDTKKWKWISGDNFINPSGFWGIKGLPNPLNKPSGRIGSVSWSENNSLYLFGGLTNSGTTYNDLWKYTIDTNCIITNINDINNQIFNNEIIIFPNPISADLTLQIKNPKYNKVKIIVYNALGENLIVIEHAQIFNYEIINTKELEDGIYYISIQIDNTKYVKKVFKRSDN